MFKRETVLFILLGGFFVTNALIAEFIGVKIFSLEASLGMEPFQISLFGSPPLSFNLTTGVLLWPVVFIMTDVINEYYGLRGVRLLSWMTAGLIAYGFLMVYMAMGLHPADFWLVREVGGAELNMDMAFNAVFGQGLWIIAGSLTAFLLGQMVDVWVFHRIKKATGEKGIWLRATGSTLVSQFIDSFVVLFIAFYLGAGWDFSLVMAICLVNYLYKFIVAFALTPFLYLAHWAIDRFLGHDLAARLRDQAHNGYGDTPTA